MAEEKQKIKATIIIEMMGRPVEHLKEVMEKLITEQIGKEKGTKVTGKRDHEPKKVESKDEDGKPISVAEDQTLYTTFSEVDLEADDIFDIIRISFVYMPANIEIVSPTQLNFSNIDLNSLVNGLLAKLHNYDYVAKAALMENQLLGSKLASLTQPRLRMEPVENIQTDDKKNGRKEKKKK